MEQSRLLHWMHLALDAARENLALGEVPIGAVLVYADQAIAVACNQSGPLAHAELLALEAGCRLLTQSQMEQAVLFVTLEPCPMCLGAILQTHVGHVVFAASNLKWGCCGTVLDLTRPFPGHCQVIGGICEQAASELLRTFFQDLRAGNSPGL